MSASRAAIFSGLPGNIELREILRPVPAANEILVRVLGCTLCGSDLHTFAGRRQVAVPTILGHEVVGQIIEIGPRAATCDMTGQHLQSGDRVTWSIVASCGSCFFCQRDLPQKCVQAVKYGHEQLKPGRELLGGLAEHCLLVPGTSIVKLPAELPLEVACPANCSTATAAAAIEAAGELRGRSVCVLGAGLLGLSVSAMASAHGASEVICVETHPERRARARQFGSTAVVAPAELHEAVHRATSGHGIDVAFEVSGSPEAFTGVWPLVRTGGTLVVVGTVFSSPPVELHLEQLVRRHLNIRGIHNYRPRHLLSAVRFLTEFGLRFPFAELVAEWHPLTQVELAFQRARDTSKIRVGIQFADCK